MIFWGNQLYSQNTFYDITFKEIIIDYALNLSLINKFVFTETNLFIERMNIHNTPVENKPPNYFLFMIFSAFETDVDIALNNLGIDNYEIYRILKAKFIANNIKSSQNLKKLEDTMKSIGWAATGGRKNI